jgi:hypothetical protein
MKKLLVLLACACIAPALADEAGKDKAKKKSESSVSRTLEKTGKNIWISPSDKERRAKRKAAKAKEEKK